MSEREQVEHFSNDLDAIVNRYRSEYEMCYANLVGALQMKIHLLCAEASKGEEEEA